MKASIRKPTTETADASRAKVYRKASFFYWLIKVTTLLSHLPPQIIGCHVSMLMRRRDQVPVNTLHMLVRGLVHIQISARASL